MSGFSIHKLGWVVAAAILGIIAASGFQGATDKVAVVDMDSLIHDSNIGKSSNQELQSMLDTRTAFLQFLDTNPVLTAESSTRLHDLWIKPTRTDSENAEMERIKADAVAAVKKQQELSTKNMTTEERTLMEDYARRSEATRQLLQNWDQEFSNQMQQAKSDKLKLVYDKAVAATQSVAKTQAVNVVFTTQTAPYGANDMTAAALQAMNGTP